MDSYEHCIDGGLQYSQRAKQNRRILENNPDFVEAIHNGQRTFYNIRTGGFFADPTVEYNEGHKGLAFASGPYSSLRSAEIQPLPSTHHRGSLEAYPFAAMSGDKSRNNASGPCSRDFGVCGSL
ncbi:uncharacterized protein H6S33_011455 [Morchella sextelata]|uniref:uncharacterized protein n=1 Tax=Morchella sextelata TaxID=1174677 RepID=UPI001D0505E1|nr:uncharacterized protein H6S33_011455 [Morchella sextelata]KAH0611028.1 hypothetical protein H6S33_011455 [Morchella sextelata]